MLDKTFDPNTVDAKWYKIWEEANCFLADPESKKPPYCIIMPPPNVTGALHMGHALVTTLQDTLIRWKRMQGFETLWVPGVDHAGIATQTVVERHLIKKMGKTRKEFARDEFLSHVWEWKEANEGRIVEQLKALGASCDWSKKRFTMDAEASRAVRFMFKKMYDEGLIYRGDYLVNWDPVTETAIADDEVEYEERASFLWHFRYPLEDGSGYVEVATTRPETMLGDTAIAVNPKDARVAHHLGKTVMLPLANRPIPIIADHTVDPEFGTGCVKVTPAHDPNDYQMALRHNLPFINIMTPDGRINDNGGQFAGLTMEEARAAVVQAMDKLGLHPRKEAHIHRVGLSYRSKAVIEPFLSKQWFVKMSAFQPMLKRLVETGDVKLLPDSWINTYNHWIDNLRDWCISRQLWWGHQIPIWYNRDNPDEMICADGDDVPPEVAKQPDKWVQDEDVLDTWFSSALWPMSTLGWPKKTALFDTFYPTSVLITGHDILFFWIARMMMMGTYATGKAPFPETFMHGLIFGKSYWRTKKEGGISYVSDEERLQFDLGQPVPKDVSFKWEKMSKSKGNVIDPAEIIEAYGTDAMRLALTASVSSGREIDLDRRRFAEFKNFANKIWNGARFVMMQLADDKDPLTPKEFAEGLDDTLIALEDRWILSVLNRTVRDVNQHLANYRFDLAANLAYDFFWQQFCAYYVEFSKPVLFAGGAGRKNKQKLLAIVLTASIRLMHPIAPFITEEIFSIVRDTLAGVPAKSHADAYTKETSAALDSPFCMTAPYPTVIAEQDIDDATEKTFSFLEEIIYTLRNIRGEVNIPPSQAIDIYVIAEADDPLRALVDNHRHLIAALIRTTGITLTSQEPPHNQSATALCRSLKILVPIPEELLARELKRLEKEKLRLQGALDGLQCRLNNEDFVSRAPDRLIAETRDNLQKTREALCETEEKLTRLTT